MLQLHLLGYNQTFERYLTICYASGVSPVIRLTKTDLISDQLADIKGSIACRIKEVPVF